MAGFGLTVLIHAALVGAVVLGTMGSKAAIEEQIEPKMIAFDEVELLALGEEKPDPIALPRIANPAPPKVRPDEVNLARKEQEEPEKKEPEKEEPEPEQEIDPAMAEALAGLHDPSRPTNDEVPEGSAEGIAGGTSTDTALKSLMNTYAVKLKTARSPSTGRCRPRSRRPSFGG